MMGSLEELIALPRPSRDTARRVLQSESRALAELVDHLDDAFDRAVEMISSCKGRVVVTGMGKSGIVSQKIAATLSSTGSPAFFMHPAEAVHGDLGMIVEGDVVVALSNSGETEEIVRVLELIRRLGARIIGISGDARSTLARNSDVHIFAGVAREACSLDLVPTASTTAAMAMGDALAVACYEARGFSARDYARYHAGGRLGRKLVQVQHLMHAGNELPSVSETAGMADTVREMSDKGLGMSCVVGADGRLVGVLTDGDLRRRILGERRPLEGTVSDAMTRNPSTVAPDDLATRALGIMEDKKITSLPVVDSAGILKGVIQIHDLWRTELF
jgi:arabinose-5-phosphate isomerase